MSAAGVGTAVGGLFDRSADRYDRINTAITFGQDRRWRRWAARSVVRRPGLRVLDACAGTGLVGLEAARLGARVTLADVSPGMLARARERAAARRLDVSICLVDLADPQAEAEPRRTSTASPWPSGCATSTMPSLSCGAWRRPCDRTANSCCSRR